MATNNIFSNALFESVLPYGHHLYEWATQEIMFCQKYFQSLIVLCALDATVQLFDLLRRLHFHWPYIQTCTIQYCTVIFNLNICNLTSDLTSLIDHAISDIFLIILVILFYSVTIIYHRRMILIGEMGELRILAEQESQAAVKADKRLTMLMLAVCAIWVYNEFYCCDQYHVRWRCPQQ